MFIAYVIKANQARRTQNALTSKHRTSASPSSASTAHRSSTRTLVPTVAARRPVEESGGSDRSERITPLCTSTTDSGVSKDIECADTVAVATSTTATTTGAGGMHEDLELQSFHECLELQSAHATPRCPAPQSNMHSSAVDIPEHNRAPNVSLHIDTAPLPYRGARGGKRVVPVRESVAGAHVEVEADGQVQNRGVTALDIVLTNNLRYDSETVGRIRTEIQEFYQAQQGEEV